MLMTEYETTVVVRPDVTGEQVESTLDRVRDVIGKQGGKLIEIEHWGKKKLAYPIRKQPRGIFVRTHFLGVGGLVTELERNLRLNENVMRFMTIKMNACVEAEALEEKEYVAPSYDEVDDEPEPRDDFRSDYDDDYDDDRGRSRDRDRDRDYDEEDDHRRGRDENREDEE